VAAYTRTPYLIVHREHQTRKDVYGSVDDTVVVQAQLLRGEAPSSTAVVAMHPIGSPGYLPMFSNLARGGHHVVACATRYPNGDAALQMENVLLDLAACVRDARERLGYDRIVLVGWSGGGSLMATYQAEAEQRTITRTAAGEATPLADAVLLPADGLLLIATHRSRHHLLTDLLDASIVDELDPEKRERDLDLYDPANPNQPPYSADFLDSYRAAQRARNARITAWAKDRLAELQMTGREQDERCFLVHSTMADPRWLDPTVDPNDRRPGWSYLGDPRLANNSAVALGRYTTTRSWLSQWSLTDAQVDAVDAGPRITVPAMVMTASADDACPPSHAEAIFGALGSPDKLRCEVAGANHYFSGADGRQHLAEAGAMIDGWMDSHGFVG
jgi:alpha-beta hydrolase superfamily lysophospholipase